ncbi:hypothetical protein NO932_18055 [Pelagibacterium sp. 26DY04]|uniref:hypothetical protein n=1 Tax=Pelagibacterium sp. 26DY04 TaxID=2967130 RepID=UPI0028167D6F|nr:hypothetical protein [Pelagibacterium sp. 26DY04]WMT86780.1 hypothetical protein NO932_18055 [Pelagibacterium sp. 26DY04]
MTLSKGRSMQQTDPVFPASSSAFLPESSPLRRLPLKPRRKRPAEFLKRYESRALVYDCFWDMSGQGVILVCPPALNLDPLFRDARFTANGTPLNGAFFPSRSTMLIALDGVPDTAREIDLAFAGLNFSLPIQPNQAERFDGRNVLVTMNKDNDLDWITAWAKWHVRLHGADACLFFDNGSTRYTPAEIAGALSVDGMAEIAILSWPHKYGRKDPAILDRPHYPHFLQVSSLNVALRRFAGRAGGLLNCDIDELVGTLEGRTIFDFARQSPDGLVTLKGRWIEPVVTDTAPGDIPHLAYRQTSRLPFLSHCANKWALDPSRDWIADLGAKPSVHRIYDVPRSLLRAAPEAPFWHFKAINTGWKESRDSDRPPALSLRRLEALDADARRYAGAL